MNVEFHCPKCGSHMFGSSHLPGEDFRWHCHGNERWSCDFSATEAEEDTCFRISRAGALARAEAAEARCAKMESALHLIAAPKRSDGIWNRDREACRKLAVEALAADQEKEA